MDKFSKYAHFVPLAHPFSALDVAQAFMKNIFKLHGLPLVIISDRDKIFTSHLWQHLFDLAGTKLHLSSAYHPQSDGQTERVNQCLEIYLRCFVHSVPSKWFAWLHLAEYWYNTSFHSAIQSSPFEVLYGHTPNHFGISPMDCIVPDIASWLSERKLMQQLVQQHLNRAKQQMKHFADKHRSFREFAVGDWVYLKLQPYIQTLVAARANHKLSFKYFGPFQILERIGGVAYKLQLPPTSSIHPVFHVSQLKSATGFQAPVQPQLPTSHSVLQYPLAVLDSRLAKKGNDTVSQVLIHWSDSLPAEATWEDLEELRNRFPGALAWGQANFQGWGLVRHTLDMIDEQAELIPDANDKLQEGAITEDDKEEAGRPKRNRKPNIKVHGPEWTA